MDIGPANILVSNWHTHTWALCVRQIDTALAPRVGDPTVRQLVIQLVQAHGQARDHELRVFNRRPVPSYFADLPARCDGLIREAP
jgi:hypothetical protein